MDGEAQFLVPGNESVVIWMVYRQARLTILESVRLFDRFPSFWLLFPVSWRSKDLVYPLFSGLGGSWLDRQLLRECRFPDRRNCCRQRCQLCEPH